MKLFENYLIGYKSQKTEPQKGLYLSNLINYRKTIQKINPILRTAFLTFLSQSIILKQLQYKAGPMLRIFLIKLQNFQVILNFSFPFFLNINP